MLIYVANKSVREMIQSWVNIHPWKSEVVFATSFMDLEEKVKTAQQEKSELILIMDFFTEIEIDSMLNGDDFRLFVHRVRQNVSTHVFLRRNLQKEIPHRIVCDGKIPFDAFDGHLYTFISSFFQMNKDLLQVMTGLDWR